MDATSARAAVLDLFEKTSITIDQFVEYNSKQRGYGCSVDNIKQFLFAGGNSKSIGLVVKCWLEGKSKEEYIAECQTALQLIKQSKKEEFHMQGGIHFTIARKIHGSKPALTLHTNTYYNNQLRTEPFSRGNGICDPLPALIWKLIKFDRVAHKDSVATITNKLADIYKPMDRLKMEGKEVEYWLQAVNLLASKYLHYPRLGKTDCSQDYGELLLHIEAYPPPRIYFISGYVFGWYKHVPANSKSLFIVFGNNTFAYDKVPHIRIYKYPGLEQYKDYVHVEINLVMANLHYDLPKGIKFYIIGGKTISPGTIVKDRDIIYVGTDINNAKLIY